MGLSWSIAALIWGLGEATLFFIVPDVLLTLAVVRHGLQPALRLTGVVLAGALMGGTLMHVWGTTSLTTARSALDAVPLVTTDMIERVSAQMKESWLGSMLVGAFSGTPYKVFAVESATTDVSLVAFLFGSIAARVQRWIILIALTSGIVAALHHTGLERFAQGIWAVAWVAFYALFFAIMPW